MSAISPSRESKENQVLIEKAINKSDLGLKSLFCLFGFCAIIAISFVYFEDHLTQFSSSLTSTKLKSSPPKVVIQKDLKDVYDYEPIIPDSDNGLKTELPKDVQKSTPEKTRKIEKDEVVKPVIQTLQSNDNKKPSDAKPVLHQSPQSKEDDNKKSSEIPKLKKSPKQKTSTNGKQKKSKLTGNTDTKNKEIPETPKVKSKLMRLLNPKDSKIRDPIAPVKESTENSKVKSPEIKTDNKILEKVAPAEKLVDVPAPAPLQTLPPLTNEEIESKAPTEAKNPDPPLEEFSIISQDPYNPGEIRSVANSNLCLDASSEEAAPVGLYGCHGLQGNQYWQLSNNDELKRQEFCADFFGGTTIPMSLCHGAKGNQEWTYDTSTQLLHHPHSNTCLTFVDNSQVTMQSCMDSDINQKWIWKQHSITHLDYLEF